MMRPHSTSRASRGGMPHPCSLQATASAGLQDRIFVIVELEMRDGIRADSISRTGRNGSQEESRGERDAPETNNRCEDEQESLDMQETKPN